MKFDVVVGNPPYQENDKIEKERTNGTVNASAKPLYNLFYELAEKITKESVCLIFPSKWLSGGGKGLKSFYTKMLNNKQIKSLQIFKNGKYIFPNTEIKGGVLILLFDKNYEGKANIFLKDSDDKEYRFKSFINTENLGLFLPYGELLTIYKKVINDKQFDSFQSIVSTRKPFGLTTDFISKNMDANIFFNQKKLNTDIEIIGLVDLKRVSKFVNRETIQFNNNDMINKWKLFLPYAYGKGKFGESLPEVILAGPNQVCTETFLCIGPFDTKNEAEFILNYMNTRFFRALISIYKVTHHSTGTFKAIPLIDFSKQNYNMNSEELDLFLFNKYKLDEKEIEFLKEKIIL